MASTRRGRRRRHDHDGAVPTAAGEVALGEACLGIDCTVGAPCPGASPVGPSASGALAAAPASCRGRDIVALVLVTFPDGRGGAAAQPDAHVGACGGLGRIGSASATAQRLAQAPGGGRGMPSSGRGVGAAGAGACFPRSPCALPAAAGRGGSRCSSKRRRQHGGGSGRGGSRAVSRLGCQAVGVRHGLGCRGRAAGG